MGRIAMLERGQTVRFHYLWARQAQVGEEPGRKACQVCIVAHTPGNPDAIYLFPITSQEPRPERVALSFPEMEYRPPGRPFPPVGSPSMNITASSWTRLSASSQLGRLAM